MSAASSSNNSGAGAAAEKQAAAASHDEEKHEVQLYLYDLSRGMAKMFSQAFVGKQIEGIWHTGIVVYGHEYYYGGGIQYGSPGRTMAGQPLRIINLGFTSIDQATFHSFLHEIAPRFTPATYSLLMHNCNNFTSECSQFLTGNDIPSYITGLPEEALSGPGGQMLRPFIEQMEGGMKEGGGVGVPWQEEAVGAFINLPPVRKPAKPAQTKPAAAPAASSAASTAQPAAGAAAAPAVASPAAGGAAAAASPSATSQQQLAAAALVTALAANNAKNAEQKSSHGHMSLNLSIAASASQQKPLLSSDAQHKSFETLIKVANKKLSAAEGALSDAELKVLSDTVAALQQQNAADAAVAPGLPLLERMVLRWPAKQQFGVLGLFRLLLLRPTAAEYFLARDAVVARLAKLVNNTDEKDVEHHGAPAAAQTMALCSFANFFALHANANVNQAQALMRLASDERVIGAVARGLRSADKGVRTAAATLAYNFALILPRDDSDGVMSLVSALSESAPTEVELETAARATSALAATILCNSGAALVVSTLAPDWNALRKLAATADAASASAKRLLENISDLEKISQFENAQIAADQ